MKVTCAREVFDKFPDASIHGVVFKRLDLLDEQTAQRWKEKAVRSVGESNIRPELLSEVPEIRDWRSAFQSFGLKPSKYRSSVEQLYRRALKGDIIQTRLPLVNLYCYVSILDRVPMGGYDLRKIEGDIEVRRAVAGEEFTAIGEKSPLQSEGGVIVYSDQSGIICWGWNHRDCARTCLGPDTQEAIFFADSASESSRPAAGEAVKTLAGILTSAGCVKLDDFVLDRHHDEAVVSC